LSFPPVSVSLFRAVGELFVPDQASSNAFSPLPLPISPLITPFTSKSSPNSASFASTFSAQFLFTFSDSISLFPRFFASVSLSESLLQPFAKSLVFGVP